MNFNYIQWKFCAASLSSSGWQIYMLLAKLLLLLFCGTFSHFSYFEFDKWTWAAPLRRAHNQGGHVTLFDTHNFHKTKKLKIIQIRFTWKIHTKTKKQIILHYAHKCDAAWHFWCLPLLRPFVAVSTHSHVAYMLLASICCIMYIHFLVYKIDNKYNEI